MLALPAWLWASIGTLVFLVACFFVYGYGVRHGLSIRRQATRDGFDLPGIPQPDLEDDVDPPGVNSEPWRVDFRQIHWPDCPESSWQGAMHEFQGTTDAPCSTLFCVFCEERFVVLPADSIEDQPFPYVDQLETAFHDQNAVIRQAEMNLAEIDTDDLDGLDSLRIKELRNELDLCHERNVERVTGAEDELEEIPDELGL